MARRWDALKNRILRALDDEDRSTSVATWSDSELVDYLGFALDDLANHTARQVVWEYDTTEETTQVELPDDVLAIGPVWFPDREILVKIDLDPGMLFNDETVTSSSYPQGYYEWPEGVLNLTRSLGAEETLTVFYWGYYRVPDQDEKNLDSPRWADEALYWYVIGTAMTKPGISEAMLNRFNRKQDQGDPEQNSVKKYSQYCMERYQGILNQHPVQDRTRWQQS